MRKSKRRGLILLDRDGVLNQMVVDAEQGTVDSPLVPSQVRMIPRAVKAAARLTRAGFGLAIVSNQPAAAKGKTTRRNLEAVQARVVKLLQAGGARILSSHLCFHRAEDRCSCRKPRTGLLKEAFAQNRGYDRRDSWMAGDGASDIQAGQAFGIKTAFLARHKTETCQCLREKNLKPTLWADDLLDFARQILP